MQLREHGGATTLEAATPLTVREQVTLSVMWFGLNFQSSALLPIVIPTQILLFIAPGEVGVAQQATFIAGLAAVGALVALLVPPIIGKLSDHTPGPLGRRRPYILVGTVLLLLGALELASAREAGAFVLGYIVITLGSGIGTAAYQSLVPDRVPYEQRGTASGFIGLMTILGNVGSLAVAGLLLGAVVKGLSSQGIITRGAYLYYGLTALVLLGSVLATLFWVRETPLEQLPHVKAATGERDERPALHARLKRDWLDPWGHHNFRWVFLTRAFVMLGLTLFLQFIEYYFEKVEHVTNFVAATALIAVLALVGAVFSALIVGVLSDRVGRVPLVCAATFLMGLAALPFFIAPGLVPMWVLGVVFGLGYGAYSSVDWALAIDALPSLEAAGKDMGLWSIASNLPAIGAPLLGGLVISIAAGAGALALGYQLIFGLADIFFILGAVCVLFVRESRPRLVEATA
jgi:MFS family permease